MALLQSLLHFAPAQCCAAIITLTFIRSFYLWYARDNEKHHDIQPSSAKQACAAVSSAEPAEESVLRQKPVSVNYHFARKCNKECGFCFHTEKSSHVASDNEMKLGLQLLKDAEMKKINFAGGEPFLYLRTRFPMPILQRDLATQISLNYYERNQGHSFVAGEEQILRGCSWS